MHYERKQVFEFIINSIVDVMFIFNPSIGAIYHFFNVFLYIKKENNIDKFKIHNFFYWKLCQVPQSQPSP